MSFSTSALKLNMTRARRWGFTFDQAGNAFSAASMAFVTSSRDARIGLRLNLTRGGVPDIMVAGRVPFRMLSIDKVVQVLSLSRLLFSCSPAEIDGFDLSRREDGFRYYCSCAQPLPLGEVSPRSARGLGEGFILMPPAQTP